MTRSSKINRRSALALLGGGALGAPLFVGSEAWAHDGHGTVGGMADVVSATRDGTVLSLVLGLEAPASGDLSIEAVATSIGLVEAAHLPVILKAGQREELSLSITLSEDLPGLFTLVLDLGQGRSGPLTVLTPSDILDS